LQQSTAKIGDGDGDGVAGSLLPAVRGEVWHMWAFPGHNGTVVVGCDSSGESQNAVVEATQEASRRGSELVLLSVAEHRPYWPDSLAWVARAEAESAQQAQAAADCAMASALATGSLGRRADRDRARRPIRWSWTTWLVIPACWFWEAAATGAS